MKKPIEYELIITVVKKGYSDYVVSASREVGATGATILFGHGTDTVNTQEFLGLTIQPEKEVVLIVSKTTKSKKIMKSILTCADLKNEGNGICFTLPITNVQGLSNIF